MPNGFMKILKSGKTYSMGIAVGIATWLIAYVVSFFKIVNVLNIGGQKVTTGALSLQIGTTAVGMGTANALGVKAMAYLTAIPIVGGFFAGLITGDSFMALVVVTAGSIILVIIGRTIYSISPLKGRPRWKLAVELLYGAGVATIIIAGLGGVGMSAVLTLAIYYAIVATVVNLLARYAKWYGRLVRD